MSGKRLGHRLGLGILRPFKRSWTARSHPPRRMKVSLARHRASVLRCRQATAAMVWNVTFRARSLPGHQPGPPEEPFRRGPHRAPSAVTTHPGVAKVCSSQSPGTFTAKYRLVCAQHSAWVISPQQFPLTRSVLACGGRSRCDRRWRERGARAFPRVVARCLRSGYLVALKSLLVTHPATACAFTRCPRGWAPARDARMPVPGTTSPSPGAESPETAHAAAPRSSAPVRPSPARPETGHSSAAGTGR